MKKILIAILALLYMGTSTGATLHLHYCMGKLIGWDFAHSDSHVCGKCGMEKDPTKNKGCCKDEQKHIKVQDDQKTAELALQLMHQCGIAAVPVYGTLPAAPLFSAAVLHAAAHDPPGSSVVPLFVLHSVFRI